MKQITEQKILRQKNINTLALQRSEKKEYENSVKEVSVFCVEKNVTRNSAPFFKFLTNKNHQSLVFR